MNKQLNEMTAEELLALHNELAEAQGVEQVTEFKSLKAARAAVAKLQKPPKAPKVEKQPADLAALGRGPVQGVGKFAKELLLEGKTNKEVLAIVLEQFPNAKTSAACIAFYRTKLIAEGKLVATRVAKSKAEEVVEATDEVTEAEAA